MNSDSFNSGASDVAKRRSGTSTAQLLTPSTVDLAPSELPFMCKHHYVSDTIVLHCEDPASVRPAIILVRAGADGAKVVHSELRRHTNAFAIMIELTEQERLILDLPSCEAVNGGTALCLGRVDKVKDGTVPMPTASTCWDELVAAELRPMTWMGAEDGVKMKIVLPNEQ